MLRILQIVNPVIPVPPTHHGGVERIVDRLTVGLIERGHHVTLAAHPNSTAPVELYPLAPALGPFGPRPIHDVLKLAGLLRAQPFDIIHNHGRMLNLVPLWGRWIPRVQTFHLVVGPDTLRRLKVLRLLHGERLCCVSVSDSQRSAFYQTGHWETIYNGIASDRYRFQPSVDANAPLVFLGRIEPAKGTDLAIEVAKASGRRLIIAGPYHEDKGDWRRYFEERILPQVDGKQITYIGPVDDDQKNSLLGGSSALLMPVQFDEPFGMVMAEAMACGTPVIGLARGAVAEVVSQGETGFVCANVEEMVLSVSKLPAVSRMACRRRYEQLFSDRVMVQAYEALYLRLVGA
jgi:glycosyltransferase involved in cell wall biosynthesis